MSMQILFLLLLARGDNEKTSAGFSETLQYFQKAAIHVMLTTL
jgi:hypothetical protein